MDRKKRSMLSIFVLAILALSFAVPFVSVKAIAAPNVSDDTVQVGDTIVVYGTTDDVTSGSDVKVYWDIASGANAYLLNTTEGASDGNYSCQITIPETPAGTHYVWVEDVATGDTAKSGALTVSPELDVSATSGLPGDTVTLTGTGFDADAGYNVSIFNMTASHVDVSVAIVEENDEETDEYGSFELDVTVPSSVNEYDDYWFNVSSATAGATFNVTVAFTVGASITLTEDEGPEGYVIEISGRGFTADQTLTLGNVTWDWGYNLTWVDDPDVDSDGDFTGEIVAPSWGEGSWRVNVSDGNWWAEDNFTIAGVASVTVDPTFGAPGTSITVTGENFTQIKGTDVTVTLNTTTVSADTKADGTWTASLAAPATEFRTHGVNATDDYGVNASATFKVGLIAMLINPTSGPSGTNVSLTGIGFTDGTYNMTFGDDQLITDGDVVSEQISDYFTIPTADPGTYTVLVDDGDNEVSTTFTVTATTSLTGTPSDVAVGYNMTIYGEHFTEWDDTALTFYVYNSTWESAALTVNETAGTVSTVTEDGNFTGYWVAPDDLLLGNTYTLNATDANDLWAEFTITVVPEEVEIGPNKASYSLGDTITFTIKATFAKDNSYLEITDTNDERVFISTFGAGEWEEISGWQVVRIPNQVQDTTMNPLMIPSDGVTGTWVWTLYDADDEVIKNGTIEVLPTTAAQVNERLTEVESSISGLSEDIGGLTTDISGVKSDLSGVKSDLSGVKSDLDTVKSDIIADLSDEIATATSAANSASDAVGDLEDTVSDIADTANNAKTSADSAKTAADAAKASADEAKTAASGLTTLVYGAIGASLIAALAAIVSLMQISRRIAG
jgi:archaellum component FlaC